MEADKTTSLKRKPLSDCTNTTNRRKPPSSPVVQPKSSISIISPTPNPNPPPYPKSSVSIISPTLNPNHPPKSSTSIAAKPPKSSLSIAAAKSSISLAVENVKPRKASISVSTATKTSISIAANTTSSLKSTPVERVSDVSSNLPSVDANPSLSNSDDADHRSSKLPVSQSQRQDARTRMDKGKMAVETPTIQISNSFTPTTIQLSSVASGSRNFSGPAAIRNENLERSPQKEKGKAYLEASNMVASDPGTPHANLASSSSAFGADDQEKTDSLTIRILRRSPRIRQHVLGKTIAPFSCPPQKRTKSKRVESAHVKGDKQYGSHTDPLPLHKKKRSRNKKDESMHGMPQDEIERLKSYYADIDAFELPEEVASESDGD